MNDWVTWGLQLAIAALLARVWIQLDKNTDSISRLREHIPTHYLPRREFEDFKKEMDKSIHDIRGAAHSTDMQVAELRAQSE